jgi:predicted DsbA family dithiol-disulfide isomerase
MTRAMTIDFVSDVACPWCAIGLHGLEIALARAADAVDAQIHFQPFELSPDMPAAGENMVAYLSGRYGSPPEQILANRAVLRERAAEVGFAINLDDQSRIYNTFDAHRLLCWAEPQGRQQALKHALFAAYFTRGKNPGDHDVLARAAEQAGLDKAEARAVLLSDRYADDVRQAEHLWQSRGITGVPAAIIDGRYLVSGAQSPEAYEQVIRQIAAEPQPQS